MYIWKKLMAAICHSIGTRGCWGLNLRAWEIDSAKCKKHLKSVWGKMWGWCKNLGTLKLICQIDTQKKMLVDAQTLELSWGDFLASQVPIKVLKLATWFLGCWEFQDSALQSFTRGKASALAVGKKIRPLETRAVIKFRECSGMHVCALASVHMYPNMFCRYIHLYVNSIWRFTSLYALVHIYLYIYSWYIYI